MSLDTLSANDRVKVRQIIEEGLKVNQQLKDLRDGLREVIKATAEELQVQPKSIREAIRMSFSSTLDERKATLDEAEELLIAAGRR